MRRFELPDSAASDGFETEFKTQQPVAEIPKTPARGTRDFCHDEMDSSQ